MNRHARPRARFAIAAVFFVNGCTFSSWSPRLPELQARLGVSDAALGVTLVGAGIGGLLASVVSGRMVDRFGSRTMTVVTSTGLSLGLPLVAWSPVAAALFAVLIALGALDGLTDVAMNAQAIELQRHLARTILSRFHALWSFGAVTGGIVASRAAAAGVTLRLHLSVVAVVLVATTLVMGRGLLPNDRRHANAFPSDDGAPMDRGRPRLAIVALFAVGLGTALAEIPANDWAALLMAQRFDLSDGRAALGFVAIAGGMLAGRLVGDHVADTIGFERTRRGGALVAAAGIVVATTVGLPVVAGLGLFVAGVGLSSLFPLAFRAASEMVPGHAGMASFSSGARLGILLASPAVGLIAGRSSIAVGLLLVAGSAAVVIGAARLPRQPAVTPPS